MRYCPNCGKALQYSIGIRGGVLQWSCCECGLTMPQEAWANMEWAISQAMKYSKWKCHKCGELVGVDDLDHASQCINEYE